MNEGKAPVAVVIVSWNSAEFLPDCLDSLERLERPPAEVVVVDNGSTDESAELVAGRSERFRLIRAGENLGFCAANNVGIRETRSPFVLALNPDTRLDPRFLEELLPAFEQPSVGIATGKLLRFDGVTIDSAGQELGRSRQPKDRGYGQADDGRYDRDAEVFGACGAAALYRRTMLESIADPGECYFDESFFAFVEDLDLAWRARRRGFRAVYRYRAIGFHARGGSASGPPWMRSVAAMLGRSPEIRFHVAKNRYLTILRNDTRRAYIANLPFIWGRDLATLALLLGSPTVLLRLWRSRSIFVAAIEKGRLDASRSGHQLQ